MKLRPGPRHRQLRLSILNQPPTDLPERQDRELSQALMELLIQAAASETQVDTEISGGQNESETHQ